MNDVNIKNITFLELVKKHFEKKSNFDIKKYIFGYHNTYDKDNIRNINICDILPTSSCLIEYNDHRIEYIEISNNCYLIYKHIYIYENYYILFDVHHTGSAMTGEIFDIYHNYLISYDPDSNKSIDQYEILSNFYKSCFTIVPIKNFNYYNYLDSRYIGIVTLETYLIFFKKLFPDNYLNRMNIYIDLLYLTTDIEMYIDDEKNIINQYFISNICDIIIEYIF